MPCMIELGKMSSKKHEQVGIKIGEVCDLAIITTNDNFQELKKGALKSGMKEDNIIFTDNPDEIINQIKIFASPGDVVLLEGRVPKKVIQFLK